MLTRERFPLNWAYAQINLGNSLVQLGFAYYSLGLVEPGTARLEQAIDAFDSALLELTQEGHPHDWATTQHDLGYALLAISGREQGTSRRDLAVIAFRNALDVWTQEAAPLQWSSAQFALASALYSVWYRKRNAETLDLALESYLNALGALRKESDPHMWETLSFWTGLSLAYLERFPEASVHLQNAVPSFSREILAELEFFPVSSTDDPTDLLHLGDLLQTLNKRDLAFEVWMFASTQNPDSELARTLEARMLEAK